MALLTGRVLRGRSGEGLNDVRVMIASSPCEVIDIAAVTWNDGEFELDLPTPGDYRVQFVADGYRNTIVHVSVGDTDKKIEVSLETEK